MKLKTCIAWLLLCISPLVAAEAPLNPTTTDIPQTTDAVIKLNQLAMLDQLIEVTKQNLEREKQLRAMVQDYLDTQNAYFKTPGDRELTLLMVKNAYYLLEKIKEAHLEQAFDLEFIGELTFFSQIAVKRGIPSPE